MTEKTSDTGSAALTRRNFLEQFGLVGGSTLVMSAMRSWDLMAQAGPRPVLSGRPNGTKVVVLGAGVSGWPSHTSSASSDTASACSRRAIVSEASTGRCGAASTHTELGPGGETQVCNFDEGLYHNGGPWRLPYWHTGVLGYCKELGVPLEVFINENESSYFYYEGDNVGPLAGKRVRMREVKADMIGYTCELMAKAINQSALDVPLTAEDKERFVTFLVSEGYLDSADRAYKKTTARGPGDPHDFRALLQSGFGNRIRSVIEGTGMAPMFQPVGGMDQFPKAFQRKLGDTITLGVEVVSIHQSADGVKVAYKNLKTGAMTEVSADYCVSCLPLTILSRLDVNLSPETMTAVKATPYSPSAKMGLQMKRRFWEEDDKILRRPPVLEPAVRQLFLSVVGLLRQQGHSARLLRQRADVRGGQHADQGPRRARADACQQSASADSRRVRNSVLHLLGKDPLQHGRVCGRWRRRRTDEPPGGAQ